MKERIPALQREPDVPKRRIGKWLLVLILLIVIILVVLFFRSSLSRVTEIQVTGNVHATREQVLDVLGIVPGDSFFVPGDKKLAQNVVSLAAVKEARVVKKFPGLVEVRVTEYREVAAEIGADGVIRVVLENGLSLPVDDGIMPDKPVLTGWLQDDPIRLALCATLAGLSDAMLADLSEIKPHPSATYPDRIKIFTRSRFEVITTVQKLPEKIPYIREIVENREPGKITMLEADTYLPFSAQITIEEAAKADKHKDNGTTQQ